MERLGKYDLLERVAVGGMAELFLARASAQHGFEKTVALKRILPAFAENEDFIRMFMAEAQLAAGLHHPNIAQVFDFGEENGTYYFTMEFVRGQNLRQVLAAAARRSAGMPLASVLHIITSVAAGLHHAHEHRGPEGQALDIVHRDVSPSNVILTYEGNVKLVDFGIAKAAALGPGTLSGSLKGKISYMSPEQCRGELVDRRSDIFSLSTLLWELTTGRRLFPTESNDIALLQKVEKAKVPAPTKVIPGYPKALEAILLKAMSRERDERYATALDFREALEEFAHESRLAVSSTRLAKYMDGLFPVEERPPTTTSSFPALRRDPKKSEGAGVPLPIALSRSAPLASTTAAGRKRPSETLVATSESTDTDATRDDESEKDEKSIAWMYVGAAALFLFIGGGVTAWMMSPEDTSAQSAGAPAASSKGSSSNDQSKGTLMEDSPNAEASEHSNNADAIVKAAPEADKPDEREKVAAIDEPLGDVDETNAAAANNDEQAAEDDVEATTHKPRQGHKRRRKRGQKRSTSPSVQPETPKAEPTPAPQPKPAQKPASEKRPKSDVFLPGRGDGKKTRDGKDFL